MKIGNNIAGLWPCRHVDFDRNVLSQRRLIGRLLGRQAGKQTCKISLKAGTVGIGMQASRQVQSYKQASRVRHTSRVKHTSRVRHTSRKA